MSDDDRVLVSRCLGGDQDACAALVAAHARMVGTVIWRAIGRKEEVEDLSQETFLRVFRALAWFDARAKLSTWIYTIAHRVAIDHLRKAGSRIQPAMRTDDEDGRREELGASSEPDPEKILADEQSRHLLRDAIARLPDKFRLLVVFSTTRRSRRCSECRSAPSRRTSSGASSC